MIRQQQLLGTGFRWPAAEVLATNTSVTGNITMTDTLQAVFLLRGRYY